MCKILNTIAKITRKMLLLHIKVKLIFLETCLNENKQKFIFLMKQLGVISFAILNFPVVMEKFNSCFLRKLKKIFRYLAIIK